MSTPQQTMMIRLALVFVVVSQIGWSSTSTCSAGAAPAGAAGPEGTAPAEDVLVLRTYDVGDLVITIRDYPYPGSMQNGSAPAGGPTGGGGGFGGGGGGGFGGGGGGGYFSVPSGQQAPSPSSAQLKNVARPTMLLCQFGGGSKSEKDDKGSNAVAPPTPGGGRGETARPLANSTAVTMGDLLDVLTNTVVPYTWDVTGGQGRVSPLGTTLIVWQTAHVQQMVESFLKQIREASGHRHTLTVDARWLLLTSDELDSLSANPPEVDRKALRFMPAGHDPRHHELLQRTARLPGEWHKRNVVSGYIPVVGSTENPDRAATLVSSSRPTPFRLVADTTPMRSRKLRSDTSPLSRHRISAPCSRFVRRSSAKAT